LISLAFIRMEYIEDQISRESHYIRLIMSFRGHHVVVSVQSKLVDRGRVTEGK
jgi:hypothetical protein